MQLKKWIFGAQNDATGLLLRLTIGVVMLPHGAQLFLGWFGGPGFFNTMTFFTDQIGLPWIVGASVILLQFFGSILILLGLGGRLIALSFVGMFIGMVVTSHLEYGFFMNWMGNQAGEGYEYHLLAIGAALALLVNGSGALSADRYLMRAN